MSQSVQKVSVISLFVDDFERSKGFYEKVFEASSLFEDDVSAVMRFENLLINLLKGSEADELIEPAKVGSAASGSPSMFTIFVESADETYELLKSRGVEFLNGPIDRPWGVRTAAFLDPGGFAWEIAEQLESFGETPPLGDPT